MLFYASKKGVPFGEQGQPNAPILYIWKQGIYQGSGMNISYNYTPCHQECAHQYVDGLGELKQIHDRLCLIGERQHRILFCPC